MKKLLVGTVIGVLMMAVHICWAGIPFLMNYQGMLTDTGGNPLNGDYNLTFKIYSQSSGGSALWTEVQNGIQVQDGLFNVTLGSVSTLLSSVFDDTVRYFGITVGADPELSPRIRLTSMAYAYRALVADSAAVAGSVVGSGGGWVDDGGVVRLEDSTDAVGIGTANPISNLHLKEDGGVYMRFDNGGDTSWVIGSNSAGALVIDQTHSYGGHLAAGISPESDTWLVPVKGKVGIGTMSPGVKLHIVGGGDVKEGTQNSGYLILGSSTGDHIAIDNNEIMAKASGDSVGDLYIQYSNEARTIIYGKVGIGTSSPSYKLHVIEGSTGSAVYGENTSYDTYGYLGRDVGVYGRFNSNGNHGTVGSYLSGVYGSSSSSAGVWGYSSTGTGVYYSGGLAGTGSKSCVVKTSKGPTLLYCQESPENWFEDFGEGQLSAGRCHIELDPLFLETVTINEPNPMKVFIQLNDDCNGTYVERGRTGFDVIELQGGQSNAGFTYRVVAKRSGFEDKRLNVCQAAKTDPYLYPEMKEMMDRK